MLGDQFCSSLAPFPLAPRVSFYSSADGGVTELKLFRAFVAFLPSNFSEASGSVKW